MNRWAFIFLLLLFSTFSCNDDDNSPSGNGSDIEQEFPIVYQAILPDSILPWPHHDPVISQGEYEQLIDDIFIINNYGQYQCGGTKESCYFHDGLDVVLKNGTPVFAVEAGTVKAEIGGNEFYRTLIVEDADEPGMAWAYTHIFFFAPKRGDELEQGQYIGRVNFQGVEHIHLSRIRLVDGGSWDNYSDLMHVYPGDMFEYEDESAPIIETPFLFYENNSDKRFEHGLIDTVFGEVDIVARVRDIGKYANGDVGGGNIWGDRLCVNQIHYKIYKDSEEILHRPSFDFTKMEFRFSQERWREVDVVFKHHLVADSNHINFNRFFSNYIITNARDNLEGEINIEDAMNSWDTQATNELGEPVFPDGLYEIEVSAWDSHGNHSSASSSVFVKNN